jgi:hypothetical protein
MVLPVEVGVSKFIDVADDDVHLRTRASSLTIRAMAIWATWAVSPVFCAKTYCLVI